MLLNITIIFSRVKYKELGIKAFEFPSIFSIDPAQYFPTANLCKFVWMIRQEKKTVNDQNMLLGEV